MWYKFDWLVSENEDPALQLDHHVQFTAAGDETILGIELCPFCCHCERTGHETKTDCRSVGSWKLRLFVTAVGVSALSQQS